MGRARNLRRWTRRTDRSPPSPGGSRRSCASPWALAAALARIAFYVIAGPHLGFPEQRLDLPFCIAFTTFLLVFVIEDQGYRERTAMQVKLDEIIRALDADRSKIGIEERPPKEIDSVRDVARTQEGRPTVG